MSKKKKKNKEVIYSKPIPTFLYTCDGGCKGDWITPLEAKHQGWSFQYIPAAGQVIVRCPQCTRLGSFSLRFNTMPWPYVLECSGRCSFREAIEMQRNGINIWIDGTKMGGSFWKVFLLDRHVIKIEDEKFIVEGARQKRLNERG